MRISVYLDGHIICWISIVMIVGGGEQLLTIHGKKIKNVDDPVLCGAFGYSYQRHEVIAKIIDWCLQYGTHKFPSIEKFKGFVLDEGSDMNFLPLLCTHPRYPGPYRIKMKGSRTDDFDEANRKAGLAQTPLGYTWHHKEGIVKSGTEYFCHMYLIASAYHGSRRHRGGVYEYEHLTGRTYG